MKTETFRKVYTKDRLPEKGKIFIAKTNEGSLQWISTSADGEKYIKEKIEYWLEELTQPTDDDIENAAEKYLNDKGNRYPSPDIAYQRGAKDLRDNNIHISKK